MKEGREYRGGIAQSMVQIQRRSVVLEELGTEAREELAISTNQEEYAQSLR